MKITFFSNFINHHQLYLCNELYNLTNGGFHFVACSEIEPEKIALGYEDMKGIPYVLHAHRNAESYDAAIELSLKSDVVIHGSASEEFVSERIKRDLPVFKYMERVLKRGLLHAFSPKTIKNMHQCHSRYNRKPLYLLCASAYAAMDMHRFRAYPDKAFRWGYFPEVKRYESIDALISQKEHNSILWVGRFLDWKHPEKAVKIAKHLKENGYSFKLDMIGIGPMFEQVSKMILDGNLSDVITLHGSMPPEKVREHMERSQIFLFTSDRNEGWGAVLNESMNSACAVVASHSIGSVPYLLDDGKNGFIYRNSDIRDLTNKVKTLLDNPQKAVGMGKAAYSTMAEHWNPGNAGKRFVSLAEAVCSGDGNLDLYKEGICSKSPLLRDDWYK